MRTRKAPPPMALSALRLSALLLAVHLLAPPAGRAASQKEMSLERMVEVADEIVLARVVRSEARWEGRFIVTFTTLRVEEALGGKPGEEIEVVHLGGTAVHPRLGAPVTMAVSDGLSFRANDQVVLFLKETRPGRRQVVGGAQGKFLVREDPSGKAGPAVPVGPKKLKVVREDDHHALHAEAMTLDSLRARIRAGLTKKAAQGQEEKPR